MRIVVDLQGAQTESRFHGIGRYSLEFSLALARDPRGHEIWLLLNGHDPESARELRGLFAGLVPPDRILMLVPPDGLELQIAKDRPRRTAAELTRAHLIRSVDPDCLIVTSLFEPPDSEAVTTNNAEDLDSITAAVLYDLIPLLNADVYLSDSDLRRHYEAKLAEMKRVRLLLAISASSRQEAIDHLGTDPSHVVNVSAAARDIFSPGTVSRSDLRPELGVNRRFILYTPSGYDPRKNIVGLIEAFAQLPAALRARFQLVIPSKFAPYDHERLRIAARKVGLTDDELVLTGFVSDADLIGLYRATDLFVYPSEHEGFGLPALEAMACGAPVIGSNRTSIPEIIGLDAALFDPMSVQDISRKMAEVLTDEQLRSDLREHGLVQATKFSWEQTAGRALDAIEATFATTDIQVAAPPGRQDMRQRMALVTPMPPLETGIAFYAADLLPALAAQFDVTLICDQAEVDLPAGVRPIPRHDPAWLRAHSEEFDHVVYQFGNSEFHLFMVPLLRAVPGVVVLHDFFLSGLFRAGHATGALPDGLSRAVDESHGDVAWRIDNLDELQRDFPANRSVLNDATGVIVHSGHAKELIESWYGPSDGLMLKVVDLVRSRPADESRDGARKRLGVDADARLVCTFGRVDETKRDVEVLRAWLDSDAAADPAGELHFVGAAPTGRYTRRLRRLAASHPAGARVKVVGWVSPEVYRAYLQAADVAVQLRTRSRGETSAAVLDCLNHGIPTIVNRHGSAAELPDGTVRSVPDEFTREELSAAINEVVGDEQLRARLSDAGRDHIEHRHRPEHCADAYATFLHTVSDQRQRHHTSLLRELAREVTSTRPEALADVAQAVARSVPMPVTARQILIDVTGVSEWPDLATADSLVLGRPSADRVRFVHIELVSHRPGFRLRDSHPRQPSERAGSHLPADVRPGDVVVVGAAGNLGDPGCHAVYRAAQAAGARLAVPVTASTELIDVLAVLGPSDVGIFCADQELFGVVERTGESHDVAAIRVDGPDVRLAVVQHILADR
jgi:glycosyltransferase involved in cell wall biosynthesis